MPLEDWLPGQDTLLLRDMDVPPPRMAEHVAKTRHGGAVLQGRAHTGLLGTCEPERRAVMLTNTALSVSNWEQALEVPCAST